MADGDPGSLSQTPSLRAQNHMAPVTDKQRHAEVRFQHTDLAAQCRLCDMKSSCGVTEMQLSGQQHKTVQIPIVHPFLLTVLPITIPYINRGECDWTRISVAPHHPAGRRVFRPRQEELFMPLIHKVTDLPSALALLSQY
ncbi:hypothetical protein A3462_00560 [Enterobacter bugandensis]|nr:hypothetical protein A3462_00560 [Enterobacter bugandensis]